MLEDKFEAGDDKRKEMKQERNKGKKKRKEGRKEGREGGRKRLLDCEESGQRKSDEEQSHE